MIYLFTGTPGSGKSLDVARVIKNKLRVKQPVICNFPINKKFVKNPDYFYFKGNDDLTVEYLVRFARNYFDGKRVKESSITLVIDECQMLFNAREWNKSGRAVWNKFFQVHRHFGFDIVLVTQFDSMLDKQLRALVEYEIVHRKVSNYGIKGCFIRLLMFAPVLFVRIKVWYPMKQKVSSEFLRANKNLFKLYDTYSLSFFDFDMDFDEGM